MTWGKFDDSFHSHPKVRAAWYRCSAAVGLQVMCITYAADHETDGVVPAWFVAGFFQKPKDLQAALSTLTDLGMWHRPGDECRCLVQPHRDGENFIVHDFLDYHPSKEALTKKRIGDAERKRRERGEASDLQEAA